MNLYISESTAKSVLADVPEAIEAARLSFVNEKPLTHDEWLKVMRTLVFLQVHLQLGLREEDKVKAGEKA